MLGQNLDDPLIFAAIVYESNFSQNYLELLIFIYSVQLIESIKHITLEETFALQGKITNMSIEALRA